MVEPSKVVVPHLFLFNLEWVYIDTHGTKHECRNCSHDCKICSITDQSIDIYFLNEISTFNLYTRKTVKFSSYLIITFILFFTSSTAVKIHLKISVFCDLSANVVLYHLALLTCTFVKCSWFILLNYTYT